MTNYIYLSHAIAAKSILLQHELHTSSPSTNSTQLLLTMVKPNGGGAEHAAEDAMIRASANEQSTKYKGVRKRKWGKWVSEIRLPNSRERIWLGSYDSAEKAARAFDAALFCLRGPSAKFNFPDTPPDITGGTLLSRSEIQIAASTFANSFPSPGIPDAMSDRRTTEDSPCESSMAVLDSSLYNAPIPEEPYFDLVLRQNCENFGMEYDYFPGFDELNNGFIPIPPSENDYSGTVHYYGDEDAYYGQASPLWNF